jgi:hypothetical protein
MAGLFDRVSRFARSPQGKRMMQKAQQLAKDPNTRRRIQEARGRLARRGR